MKLHHLSRNSLAATTLGLSLGMLGLAGCESQAAHQHNHWSGYFVGPSLSRAFLTYDPETDGAYRDFAWRKKQDINLTLRRHLFNDNPYNPFEPAPKNYPGPRPNNSPLPNPVPYIHVEGCVIGALTLAGGGAFIPIPIDSIIGTFDTGGTDEFMKGVDEFTKPMGTITESFLHDALGFPETHGSEWRE